MKSCRLKQYESPFTIQVFPGETLRAEAGLWSFHSHSTGSVPFSLASASVRK